MNFNGFNYPGLAISLFVVIATLALKFAGLFVMADGAVYDRLVRNNLRADDSVSQVLLVSAPLQSHDRGDDYWLALLRELQSNGAASIAFGFIPGQVSPAFFQVANDDGNVVFGRHLRNDPDVPSRLLLQPLPESADESLLRWGVVAPVPVAFGVSRRQNAALEVDAESYPALEAVIADTHPGAEDNYLVNFQAGSARVPLVTAERVINGGVIAELVLDKHVLIGLSDEVLISALQTPLDTGRQGMSLLEFQGYALDTLLQRKAPLQLGTSLALVLVILIAGFCVFIYQWLSLRMATWVSLGLISVYLISAWLLLSFALLWIPVAEMITTQVMMFFLLYRYKSVREEQGLKQMVLTSSAELHEKLVPSSFLASQEHWSQVINLVNQTLDLNRVMFLERIEGDHRLREIKALNCSMDSIVEQRRDYERTPYSTAIAAHGPIRLERPYLEESEEEEDQYLMPLMFAGDVLGFWVFGISPEKAAAIPMFMQRLKDYSLQIAELLYQRQQWQTREAGPEGLAKYLQIESGSNVYKAVHRSSELINRRMKSLEQVFDGLGTATVLYDLFGGLMQVNRRMLVLLQHDNLPIYDMTALDLMMAITDMDSGQVRHSLRHVVLEHGTLTIPARITGVEDQALVLNVRPMVHAEESGADVNDAAPFQLFGVLFELVDVTHFKKLYHFKEQLVQRLNIQLRNDMESLVFASDLLTNKTLPDDQNQRVLEIINEKVRGAVQVMEEAQQHLDTDLSGGPLERYPIDAYPIANGVVSAVAERSAERRVAIKADTARMVGLVYAEPEALADLLQTLLTIVIDDAVEGSEVQFSIQQVSQEIIFDFSNTGFGIPDDRLQEYLFGEGEVDTEEFRKLRSANGFIQMWGGRLAAKSGVGEGMRFSLYLRGFL